MYETRGKVYDTRWLRSYSRLYSQNFINRPSCSRCRYISYRRCSDITIGDYWGVERYHPQFEDSLGVSLVITNTEKGEQLFEAACSNLVKIRIGKEEANQNSLSKLPEPNNQREVFWHYYDKEGYKTAIKEVGELNFKGIIRDIARKGKRYLRK